MKTITLMCGLPRSGKSTWISENKEHQVVLSADDLRYLVYNQRFWQDGEALMWSIHNIILNMLLQQGADIIIDETNVSKKRRKPIIDMAKQYGYWTNCVWITTSKDECLNRASKLNDLFIIPVIERMSGEFEKPEYGEGIDNILIV